METIIYDCGTKDFERAGFHQWYGADLGDSPRAFIFGGIGGHDKFGTLCLGYKKAHRCITLTLNLSAGSRTMYDPAEVEKVLETIPEYAELKHYCKERAANTFTREELDTLYLECRALALKAREALEEHFADRVANDTKESTTFLRELKAEYLRQLSILNVRISKIGWANIIAMATESTQAHLKDCLHDIGTSYRYYSDEQIDRLVKCYPAHYLKQDRSVSTCAFDAAMKILDQVEKDLKG